MEDLRLAIMFMSRLIAVTSALYTDDSFERHFSNPCFCKITIQPDFIPCLDPTGNFWGGLMV